MVDDPHNVGERLWKAVEVLVTGVGTIQSRVTLAVMELAPLRIEEFVDSEAHARIIGIREMLCSVSTLTDSQAVAVAKEIFELDTHYRGISA